jgi:carboxypeptidase Q
MLLLRQETSNYFDYHHSAADTLDKVDRHDLDKCVAALATLTYALADSEEPLPRP